MKCVSYIRVSGRGQADGDGPERQKQSIKSFCERGGIEILSEFSETISGTVESMDRPVFNEMIEAIECRRINGDEIIGIVVERIDRLARDLMVSEILFSECRKRNIKVFASDHDFQDLATNDGDPSRKLIRQIFSAISEWEKSQIVLKLRKAREAVKRKQGYCGVRPYKQGTPIEQCMIDLLARTVTATTPLEEVADKLNYEGFRTRSGGIWNAKSAWRLLKQIGMHTPKDPSYRLKNLKGSPGIRFGSETQQNKGA